MQEVAVELSRYPANDRAEEDETRVAVVPVRAGTEVEGRLRRELHEVVLAVVLVEVHRAIGVVRDPRRVAEQVTDRDPPPRGLSFGEPLRDGIVERELAALGEEHDRRR